MTPHQYFYIACFLVSALIVGRFLRSLAQKDPTEPQAPSQEDSESQTPSQEDPAESQTPLAKGDLVDTSNPADLFDFISTAAIRGERIRIELDLAGVPSEMTVAFFRKVADNIESTVLEGRMISEEFAD